MKYRPTTKEDAEQLIASMRERDAAETLAWGVSVRFAVEHSLAVSDFCISGVGDEDGVLYGIGGATVPDENGEAVIWALGTRKMDEKPVTALKAPREISRMIMARSNARLFRNSIPESFDTYIKWAKRHLNATFDGEFSSATGVKFLAFHIVKGE